MRKIEELTYWKMDEIDKLRWHLVHDCTCGFLSYDEFYTPHGHYTGCPMKDSTDESWDYLYHFDCLPNN